MSTLSFLYTFYKNKPFTLVLKDFVSIYKFFWLISLKLLLFVCFFVLGFTLLEIFFSALFNLLFANSLISVSAFSNLFFFPSSNFLVIGVLSLLILHSLGGLIIILNDYVYRSTFRLILILLVILIHLNLLYQLLV